MFYISGVSSYGMEADPSRFFYLKEECFLMIHLCDIKISFMINEMFTSL